MQNIGTIMSADPLAKIIQVENFAGWIYGIDYGRALVMTNDQWKAKVLGVPHNCFLVAATFRPEELHKAPRADQEVLLLRVIGSSKLPQDDDLVRTKIDYFQDQTEKFTHASNVSTAGKPLLQASDREFDDITRNQMQFGGLECRVLGTFYVKDGELWLGSDLESFAMASRLNVYRPRGEALRTIVNHVDPLRRRAALDEAKQLGLQKPTPPFQIGTVRYTSTDRLHRSDAAERVPVFVQPSDFLARRTAVLGMTRTGKSNMVKQMVSVVKRVATEGGVKIGQIIYDINGEYANANQQDKGALADIYPKDTVRYRMMETSGFRVLLNNFYVQLDEGFAIIRRVLTENRANTTGDVGVFMNTSFDEPDQLDQSLHKRWKVRVAAYQAMLFRAGFEPPAGFVVKFEANQNVQAAVVAAASTPQKPRQFGDPSKGLSLSDAVAWFTALRSANRKTPLLSSSGNPWLDDDTESILNMMAGKNAKDTYIRGYKLLTDARQFHSPQRDHEVGDEIYDLLVQGKIVILDVSVGDPTLRESVSQQIARDIFAKSMGRFVKGDVPPNIVVYIEEAHNLIGKKLELTETWPRLAKEGAKYRIALVYATQEVSSVHPNILANTENWFITHLNNEGEIRELAKFYDFGDFSQSLMRAQDVGFARVKTLSSPYVVPVQIDKFDPQQVKSLSGS